MSNNRSISICEYEVIKVSENGVNNDITTSEREKIFNLQDDAECLAFAPVRGGIRSNQFIGVFSIDGITIEILPKIAKVSDNKNHDGLRNRLVQIISRATSANAKSNESYSNAGENSNLLEALIYLFAQKVSEYTKRGLVRDYINISDDISKLRGKLIIQRQFTKYALTPNIIACNFDEYSADIGFNRLLYCALYKIFRLTKSNINRRLVGEIMVRFAGVSLVDAKTILNQKFRETRQIKPWKQIENLARFMLKNIYQTASSGSGNGFCLFFDMNRIFEDYIASIAKEIAPNIQTQGPLKYLCKDNKFKMKPDLFLNNIGQDSIIFDTKWKLIEELSSDKISNSDAYQMFAYAENYNAKKAILLYPLTQNCNSSRQSFIFNNKQTELVTSYIDISKDTNTKRNLEEILKTK